MLAPVLAEASETGARPLLSPSSPTPSCSRRRHPAPHNPGKRVLIVEDDRLLGDALATGLRQVGHATDWFTNGSDADTALIGANFDAIVLDLGLPGSDGMVWLRRWRDRGLHLPVLVLTAREGIEQRIAGLDAGADDYLVKPISVDELAARLRALARRSAGHSGAVWQHGALEYDPASKRVRWRGEPVELTTRELALLEALMAQPQHVLSRSHLQEKLYDWSTSEPESNAIEVHIHHLRRKIDPGIVRTVRGVGYALGSGEPAP
jgi:two-component system response regulator QseB